MTTDDTLCEVIQQTIAVEETLTEAQIAHIKTCAPCATALSQIRQLDNLVEQATYNLVPQDFAERVMAHLPNPVTFPISERLLGEKLLAMFSRSRLVQTLALGLGTLLGVSHIVQFVLGLFITSIAAAL
jgi:hypothetical protein